MKNTDANLRARANLKKGEELWYIRARNYLLPVVFSLFASVESSSKDMRVTVDTSSSFPTRIKLPFIKFLGRFDLKYNLYQYELEIYFLNESYFAPWWYFRFRFNIFKDRSFHCNVCNVCLDTRLEGRHSSRENSGHDEHYLCLEVMTYFSY